MGGTPSKKFSQQKSKWEYYRRIVHGAQRAVVVTKSIAATQRSKLYDICQPLGNDWHTLPSGGEALILFSIVTEKPFVSKSSSSFCCLSTLLTIPGNILLKTLILVHQKQFFLVTASHR